MSYFILDNFHSAIMGVEGAYLVEEHDNPLPWIGAQSIVSNELAGFEYPISIRAKKECLKFTLVFSLLSQQYLPEVTNFLGRIFGKSVPVKLEVSSDRLKEIYVIPTNQRNIKRYMGDVGTFEIDFEATTPYWLTPVEHVRNRVLKSNDIFIMNNQTNVQNHTGDYLVFPYLKFQVIKAINIVTEKTNIITQNIENIVTEQDKLNMITEDSQHILMTATTPTFELIHMGDKNTPDRTIKFIDLEYNEVIEMDSRLKQLKSSKNVNRFPNWNKELFFLRPGINKFKTVYPAIVSTAISYPIYQ